MKSKEKATQDFSARVREALGDVLGAAEDFLEVGAEITAQPNREQLPQTVRQLLRTVSNSMRSVILLVEHGSGTDALKLARTMFETAVNIHYLHSHPECLQDYVDFQWIKKKKHHEYLLKIAPGQASRVDNTSLNELNREYTRVRPRFIGPKDKVRNRWHKSDHRDIARQTGGEQMYGTLYPFVSSLTHMDILGLIIATGPSGDIEEVPSATNVELGLQIALLSYAMALSATNEILKAGCDVRIQAAFERLRDSSSVRNKVNLWTALGGGER